MVKPPILFVGDTHANFKILERAADAYPDCSILQVGDIGLGFPSYTDLSTGRKFARDPETFPLNMYFIRGNHDNPEVCRKYSNYLGDFGYNKELDLFYISGAGSIDRHLRVEGRSWWRDEELSIKEFYEAIMLFKEVRPRFVVSHTCPHQVAVQVCARGIANHRTEKALEAMWEEHRPEFWVFGHWHVHFDRVILGTRFLCLPINGLYKFTRL